MMGVLVDEWMSKVIMMLVGVYVCMNELFR